MNTKGIVALVVVLAVVVAGFFYMNRSSTPQDNGPVACTMEAKLCPGGSYVGRSGPKCEFAACPADVTISWLTSTSTGQGVTFKYPAQLGTTYISLQEWPPKLALSNGTLNCTAKRTINGKDYCVTTTSEGAAGSTYKTYTYATEVAGKIATLTFTLRFPQCANYNDPQKSACTTEQSSFKLDSLISKIVGTINPSQAS